MEKRVEIGEAGFVLYFAYAAAIWLCDAVDLCCFLTGLPQVTLISRVLVALVMITCGLLLKDHVYIRKGKKPDVLYLLGCLVILGFCVYKGVIPDVSTDVKKYHILVQNPGFLSMTKDSFFFAGDFQYYGFRWPDRLFYPFRWLFGFRMGTIFGGLVNVLIFTQMRSLIAELYGEKLRVVQMRFKRCFRQPVFPGILVSESLLAFLITMIYDVWLQSGGYMVDCIAIPLILEAVHILLSREEQKLPGEMVWFASLCGCFFAMKMTHVVYIVPMIAAYLFKFRKQLTYKRFFAAFTAAMIPVSIYLIYAYADTGNPVFPYFNSIFKSPFFQAYDFKDTRWGPRDLKETLVWPFLSVIRPIERTSEFPNDYNIGMICLMAVLLVQLLFWIVSRGKEGRGDLLFIVFGSAYLWSATTGYLRYFIVGYMLTGLVFAGFAAESLYNRRWIRAAASVCIVAVMSLQPVKYMEPVAAGEEWSWRNSQDEGFFRESAKWLFKDRKPLNASAQDKPVNAIIMNGADNGGIAHLLYPQAALVFNDYLYDSVPSDEIVSQWNRKIDGYLSEGGVFDLVIPKCDGTRWEKYYASLESRGFRITDIVWPDACFVREQAVAMIELEKLEEGERNLLYAANEENNWIPAPADVFRFSASVTLNQTRGRYEYEDTLFCLIAADEIKCEQVYAAPIKERTTVYIDEELDLSGFGEDVRLEMYWLDGNGEKMDTRMYDCFIIDPRIEKVKKN